RLVLALGLQHHAHRALDNFRGKLRGLPHHGSMFSNEGASSVAGAIQKAVGCMACMVNATRGHSPLPDWFNKP
ncbi:hypothetical protein, partial [Roseateles sp.]|uniref:hypothetical protein n=1 Tax=Roseateles sp. TaxID=1971397 RepID=UPI0035A04128